jgi:Cu/Ag efflux pump CusA
MGQAPLAYERTQRHLFVQIDRALAADLDIDITRLGRAPQAVLAGAATLDQTNSGLLITSGFAILVVFLVLGAQFQGFISAVMVMATAPLGLACALSALLLTGQSLMSTARQV